MTAKKEEKKSALPEGYKTTRTGELFTIHKFEKDGDFIEGRYMGIKILPSAFSQDGSVLWMIAEQETGEIVLVNEKATMKDVRLSILNEGVSVMVVYHGEKKGKKRTYKDFEVFVKEGF